MIDRAAIHHAKAHDVVVVEVEAAVGVAVEALGAVSGRDNRGDDLESIEGSSQISGIAGLDAVDGAEVVIDFKEAGFGEAGGVLAIYLEGDVFGTLVAGDLECSIVGVDEGGGFGYIDDVDGEWLVDAESGLVGAGDLNLVAVFGFVVGGSEFSYYGVDGGVFGDLVVIKSNFGGSLSSLPVIVNKLLLKLLSSTVLDYEK